MAEQGFMAGGAVHAPQAKVLGMGQMGAGAIEKKTSPPKTKEELKKIEEQKKKDEAKREAKREKNRAKLEGNETTHVVTEEDLANNPDLVEKGVKVGDVIELPKEDEDLEKMHHLKLRDMAIKKGYTGKKFDKTTLLKFLRSNP